MTECKWCGEDCQEDSVLDFCCMACLENYMDEVDDPTEREILEDAYDRWMEDQEKEMEGRH